MKYDYEIEEEEDPDSGLMTLHYAMQSVLGIGSEAQRHWDDAVEYVLMYADDCSGQVVTHVQTLIEDALRSYIERGLKS